MPGLKPLPPEHAKVFHFSTPPPLTLYLHMPWCVRKCPYCDFNSHEPREDIPQQAYVDAGAVQCGFCTPGLIMTSTAFMEKHKDRKVSREEIRKGHAGNLCRCTGYETIIRAVKMCLEDSE